MGKAEFRERQNLSKAELGAKQAVEVCAGVKSGDRVVLVKDRKLIPVATFVEEAIKNAQGELTTLLVEDYGQRPLKKTPKEILKKVGVADVAFIVVSYFRDEFPTFWRPLSDLSNKSKVKRFLMVDIEKRLLETGMNVDYRKVREFSGRVYEAVKDAKTIRVKTELGSDFTVELGYKWVIFDGFPEPGGGVNLPDGEVLTAPKDINGRIIIDGLIEEFDKPRFGLLKDYPLSIILKSGRAVRGSIECGNQDLKAFLESSIFNQDQNACRVGEFAFGTNIFLKRLVGNLTQDEKYPSVHIAFGDPYGRMTGAPWKSEIHMDAIILEPTVWVDGEIVMKEGKYLI